MVELYLPGDGNRVVTGPLNEDVLLIRKETLICHERLEEQKSYQGIVRPESNAGKWMSRFVSSPTPKKL